MIFFSRFLQMIIKVRTGPEIVESWLIQSGPKWSKMVQSGPKWFKVVRKFHFFAGTVAPDIILIFWKFLESSGPGPVWPMGPCPWSQVGACSWILIFVPGQQFIRENRPDYRFNFDQFTLVMGPFIPVVTIIWVNWVKIQRKSKKGILDFLFGGMCLWFKRLDIRIRLILTLRTCRVPYLDISCI